MKRILFIILITLFCIQPSSAQTANHALIPLPNSINISDKTHSLPQDIGINVQGEGLDFAYEELLLFFSQKLNRRAHLYKNGSITLRLTNSEGFPEAYRLEVKPEGICIEANSATGILYGIYTLEQWIENQLVGGNQNLLTCVTIDDSPEHPFRALMLDPARNFLPLDGVKSYIDQMARYKYNVLQLHLTDDQGWRLEIKSHPKLTDIGAFRNAKAPADKAPENGFYTQAEIRELIEYASERGVTIIPEIDIPGHTAAMLTAYPDLRCDIFKDSTFQIGRETNVMLSAVNPKVYDVLDDVLKEVANIFPSKTIHLGGDESAIALNWEKSPEHQQLMKDMGYTEARQIMGYFFGKVLDSARKYQLKPILWCELDNMWMPANEYLFPYPEDVVLVTWRNGLTPKCIELTEKHGHKLILAPGEHSYLDYPQYSNDFPEFENWGMPITTLEKTYAFDPTYGLPEGNRKHLIGVMGTLWGEAIKNINRVNYMSYPRALALAEAGWTRQEKRNWEDFKQRLIPHIGWLMQNGVSVRAPFEIYK